MQEGNLVAVTLVIKYINRLIRLTYSSSLVRTDKVTIYPTEGVICMHASINGVGQAQTPGQPELGRWLMVHLSNSE